MHLFRVGTKVLNLDRVNSIIDAERMDGPDAPVGGTVLHILFDQGQIDLSGEEAESFRRWYRHSSLNLTPHKDEDGADLISPEDQVRVSFEALLARIDRVRPSDAALRHIAHRVGDIIDHFLTGELLPARAKDFRASFKEARAGE